MCALISQLVDQLAPTAPDYTLRDVCHQIVRRGIPWHIGPFWNASSQLVLLTENPDMQVQFVISHGLLAVLEILESRPSRDVLMNLLKLTNMASSFLVLHWIVLIRMPQLVTNDLGILESFCLIGYVYVMSYQPSLRCKRLPHNLQRHPCRDGYVHTVLRQMLIINNSLSVH